MIIPVFVSCPTKLNEKQQSSLTLIHQHLANLQLEPRALGRGDYPSELPLREVRTIARHCLGGIILGFTQFNTRSGVWKIGTDEERRISTPVSFPTPWNYLEAGILFGLCLPLLIFKEDNIYGGVFDPGATDVYVHRMPSPPLNSEKASALTQVFLKWSARVRDRYYNP